MKKQISTSIRIETSPKVIWDILIDFNAYPEWNPFIRSISGKLTLGAKLKVALMGMNFKPQIMELIPNKSFIWLGHLGMKGLFDGEHKFHVIDNGDGSSTFEQSERFSGILVRLFSSSLDKNTKNGFIEMNEKLKLRAEHRSLSNDK
ncbi:SRPBCC domain-containing protein [Echinicola pacifica]|nr:SRPBCC domain-containing protein [Echinicola pacifica]